MKIIEIKEKLYDTCPQCGGYGKIYTDDCYYCVGSGLETVDEINLKVAIVEDTAFINTTPHAINGVFNGKEVEIPTCGFLLNADPVERIVKEENGIKFVKTEFWSSENGNVFLNNVNTYATKEKLGVKNLIIIGSIIAVNAYQGVCGLTPMKGFERVAPDKKKMNLNKFTIKEI